jgi:hypothetical protein
MPPSVPVSLATGSGTGHLTSRHSLLPATAQGHILIAHRHRDDAYPATGGRHMPFVLNDVEVAAVRRALQAYLPELRYESARMKRPGERHELVQLDELLTDLCSRMAEAAGGTASTPPH